MKTKIKTIIALLALGIIGFTNSNAAADYKWVASGEIISESEATLAIESWMTDESIWSSNADYNTVEIEKALELEPWMIDESLWISETGMAATDTEAALDVEPWMIDENLWK